MSNNIRESIVEKMIISDCKEMLDSIFKLHEEDRSIYSMCVFPYLALIAVESYQWCKKMSLDLSDIEERHKNILNDARATIKFLANSSKKNFKEQQDDLKAEMKNSELAFGFCNLNIGVYKTVEHLSIENTIQIKYYFRNIINLNDGNSSNVLEISQRVGAIIQEIVTKLSDERYIIKYAENICNGERLFSCKDFDYNLEKTFGSITRLQIYNYICRINFLLRIFKFQCNENSMLYLRILYITFYSLKNDLKMLNIDFGNLFNGFLNREFRNGMAHYGLYSVISEVDIDQSLVGFGIIEKYFNKNYSEFISEIEERLCRILELLNKIEKFEI